MARNNYFSAEVKDGKIFEVGYPGEPIGVTLKLYNSILDKLDELVPVFKEYQKLLINLGKRDGENYINVPVTQEELIEQLMTAQTEHAKQMADLTKTVADLADIVKKAANE